MKKVILLLGILFILAGCAQEKSNVDTGQLIEGRQTCDALNPCENGGECIAVNGNPPVCFERDENVCVFLTVLTALSSSWNGHIQRMKIADSCACSMF